MERNEFALWVKALQTYYERFNLLRTREAVELWYRELEYIPAEVLLTALRKWVNSSQKGQFPPSISELKAMVAEVTIGQLPEWGEGWAEVRKAVGRYGYMREEEALASLSPITRQSVKYIGWKEVCLSENPDVVRGQFRKAYEACARRQEEDRNLSPELKAAIDRLQIGQMKEGNNGLLLQEKEVL